MVVMIKSTFIFLLFFSLSAFADSSGLKVKFLLHTNDHIDRETENDKILKLKTRTRFKVGSPLMVRTYVWGFAPNREGLISFDIDATGIHRNPKVEGRKGGTMVGQDDIRFDEALETHHLGSFDKKDVGIWDFKVTIKDRVSGKVLLHELKNVEVYE
jgi:hypothetical protein